MGVKWVKAITMTTPLFVFTQSDSSIFIVSVLGSKISEMLGRMERVYLILIGKKIRNSMGCGTDMEGI